MSEKSLAVHLIHWEAPEWCRSAIASIRRSEGLDIRLTVVDNGGGPLNLDSEVEVIKPDANLGFTGGANLALDRWLETAPGEEWCVIGSHDLHVSTDCLSRLVRAAERHPRYGLLGPTLSPQRDLPSPPDEPREIEPRPWISGTCMLIRRGCYEETKGFDEDLGSYREDVDLCRRARQAGWEVGRVSAALAHGLGTRMKNARVLDQANDLLLRAKHRGATGLAKGVIWLLFVVAKEAGIGLVSRRSGHHHFKRSIQSLQAIPLGLRKVASWRFRRAVQNDD